MLTVPEHFHAVSRVTRRIGGHEDRFNLVILDHLFERRVGLLTSAGLGQRLATVGKQIADRHDLDVRMILQGKCRAELADAKAHDAHADPTLGDRLPNLRWIVLALLFLETLNLLPGGIRGRADTVGSRT